MALISAYTRDGAEKAKWSGINRTAHMPGKVSSLCYWCPLGKIQMSQTVI